MNMVVYVGEHNLGSELQISLVFWYKLKWKTEEIVAKKVFSNRHIIMKGFKCFQLNSKIVVNEDFYNQKKAKMSDFEP